jgi:hypothetical protein
MIAFAVGGLLGDVFFHTLPHMNAKGHGESHSHEDHIHEGHEHSHEGHEHSHNPEEMQNNMIIIIGILTFFIIEKVSITLLSKDNNGCHSHSHDHSHSSKTNKVKDEIKNE